MCHQNKYLLHLKSNFSWYLILSWYHTGLSLKTSSKKTMLQKILYYTVQEEELDACNLILDESPTEGTCIFGEKEEFTVSVLLFI